MNETFQSHVMLHIQGIYYMMTNTMIHYLITKALFVQIVLCVENQGSHWLIKVKGTFHLLVPLSLIRQ